MKKREQPPIAFFLRILRGVKDNDITGMGAQLAYYLLLAMPPLLLSAIHALSFIASGHERAILRWVSFLPSTVHSVIYPLLLDIIANRSSTILSFSILTALLLASRGISSVIKRLDSIFGVENRRNLPKHLFVALVSTILLILSMASVLLLMVYSRLLLNLLFRLFGIEVFVDAIWRVLGDLLPILFMILFFTGFYKYAPGFTKENRISTKESLVGAVFSSLAWIAVTVGYSFFTDNFSQTNVAFGSLAGFMGLTVWLFLCSVVLLLGAEVICSYRIYRDRRAQRKKFLERRIRK